MNPFDRVQAVTQQRRARQQPQIDAIRAQFEGLDDETAARLLHDLLTTVNRRLQAAAHARAVDGARMQ